MKSYIKHPLIFSCLLISLLQEALSCTCVEFHEVPHSLPENTLCSNVSTYNGRDYYITDNKLAYLFYNNVNGTWQVGSSLGTTNYYLISHSNVSLPQHTTSWDVKSPISSSFSTDPNISVKCYEEKKKEKSYGLKSLYLIGVFVPIGVIFFTIRVRARQGKLCKKRTCQGVGTSAGNPTCVTTQRPCIGQQGHWMNQKPQPNGRLGEEGRKTSINDLPGYSSVSRNNAGLESQGGVQLAWNIQMPETTKTTGPPANPAVTCVSYSPPYTFSDASFPGVGNVPPPPTYDAAVTSSKY